MKFIADTSVWIDHIREPDVELTELLTKKLVLVHPVVIGELACGGFRRRHEVLGNLKILPKAQVASFEEAIEFIEIRKLQGSGLGFSDVQILASALLSESGILTRDKSMLSAIKSLGIVASP